MSSDSAIATRSSDTRAPANVQVPRSHRTNQSSIAAVGATQTPQRRSSPYAGPIHRHETLRAESRDIALWARQDRRGSLELTETLDTWVC